MLYSGDVALYLSGADVPIQPCNIFITQPTIKQIVQLGETKFLMTVQMIVNMQNFAEEVRQSTPGLENHTDFQLFLLLVREQAEVKHQFNQFFELVLPSYKPHYSEASIEFSLKSDEEEKVCGMITAFNFEAFQTTVKELFPTPKAAEDDYNPANEAAREIAKKLKKGRQAAQAQTNPDAKSSLFGTYLSLLSIGMRIDINTLFNYTHFQIFDSFERFWAKERSDDFHRMATTPMMDTSKLEAPEEWVRNLYA